MTTKIIVSIQLKGNHLRYRIENVHDKFKELQVNSEISVLIYCGIESVGKVTHNIVNCIIFK